MLAREIRQQLKGQTSWGGVEGRGVSRLCDGFVEELEIEKELKDSRRAGGLVQTEVVR